MLARESRELLTSWRASHVQQVRVRASVRVRVRVRVRMRVSYP